MHLTLRKLSATIPPVAGLRGDGAFPMLGLLGTTRARAVACFLAFAAPSAPVPYAGASAQAASQPSRFGHLEQMIGRKWLLIDQIIGKDVRYVLTYTRNADGTITTRAEGENGEVSFSIYRSPRPGELQIDYRVEGVASGDRPSSAGAVLADGSVRSFSSNGTIRRTIRLVRPGVVETTFEFLEQGTQGPWRPSSTGQMIAVSEADAQRILSVPRVGDRAEIYAFCSVRDIVFDGHHFVGRLYRSRIFAAPRNYDEIISLENSAGGRVSRMFEDWVFEATGFQQGRMGDPAGSEHWCVEAPLTPEGRRQIEQARSAHDPARHPGMIELYTGWVPPGV